MRVPAAPAADPWDSINLDGSLAEATTRVVAEAERRKIQRAVREAVVTRAARPISSKWGTGRCW